MYGNIVNIENKYHILKAGYTHNWKPIHVSTGSESLGGNVISWWVHREKEPSFGVFVKGSLGEGNMVALEHYATV